MTDKPKINTSDDLIKYTTTATMPTGLKVEISFASLPKSVQAKVVDGNIADAADQFARMTGLPVTLSEVYQYTAKP